MIELEGVQHYSRVETAMALGMSESWVRHQEAKGAFEVKGICHTVRPGLTKRFYPVVEIQRLAERRAEDEERSILIPVQPILDEIVRRGGRRNLGGMGWVEWGAVSNSANTTPEEAARFQHLKSLLRSADDGLINLYAADEICCDYLGIHPASLYGPAWFTFSEEELEEAA